MELPHGIQSPETKKVDVFDEYSLRPIYVLSSLDELDEVSRAHYRELKLSTRNVFVRSDIFELMQKPTRKFKYQDENLVSILAPSVSRAVKKILRPLLKKSHEAKTEKETAESQDYFIKYKEQEDIRRLEVAEFVATFPQHVQKRLREGAFLIESEGRYYEGVEKGLDSFASATDEGKFEAKKGGNWKRGLFKTLVAGSSSVRSFLPSTMLGVVNSFRAELKDENVTAVVMGNSFSTFGDNNLGFSMQYKEYGEEKKVSKSFKYF